jgi:lipoprotein-anchoring transpeptidase ErfK/SrfK
MRALAAMALLASVAPAAAGPAYRAVPIAQASDWTALATALGPERTAAVLRLNRLDAGHVRIGEHVIVPDEATDAVPAPLPATVDGLTAVGKVLVVSRRVQAFGAYEAGRLVRWGPVSTGKRATPTPVGLFHANWKARRTVSTDDPDWLLPWYVNVDNARGVSLHEFALPGVPASHACIRLLGDDARWLYGWVEQWILTPDGRTILAHGTPVVIFGDYAFDAPPPWSRLPEDAAAGEVSAAEMAAALEPHVPVVLARQAVRAALAVAAGPGAAAGPVVGLGTSAASGTGADP